ncbi:Crotonobetainyl-CoA:carnitine CoA-transferase CaiB [Roseivivax lentus]|uniref:Crotonobetainyl-CoA:carnitine CoA-transferase CaiB n=1 Tax=Roseivivax lentus TaxID=633194 RepID=A0A1N7KEG4_9RHOB|nr:CaiB/BaiF CoA-transferase family protein [Roseivivax lentus]SIS59909.1 Crotonobetainyl-CoA:carnitine CoA-transferase CaiB [Roseivivax lentus]
MLDGIRIVEFEGLGPAPFAAMMLAELGAEVTVLHRKGGGTHPAQAARSLLDRGKRSIALDLKAPEDAAIARALIARADGLIEGFRPGVMERLGFGPDAMQALNPALVYGRMTGWGQTGPRAQEAGHDLNYLSLSGALFYAGLPGDVPGVPPTMLGDIGGGAHYLVAGMLAGLLQAGRTGEGTVVDAAIVDGAAHMMSLLVSMGPMFSQTARGASLLDGPHWSRCYACACGGHVSVQCLEPQFYALFLARMGLSDAPAFAAQYDPAQWSDQSARLAAVFAEKTRSHWAALFEGTDACVAPVLSPAEAAADPHMAARGVWSDGVPSAAPRFAGRTSPPAAAPLRDEDRAAILAELGFGE